MGSQMDLIGNANL